MIGSQAVAAWVAHLAFWVLLTLGIMYGELTRRRVAMFVALWLLGYIGLPRISPFSGPFVISYVAILDIVLVFIVFKGDVRLA
jgi:hypothetical protein